MNDSEHEKAAAAIAAGRATLGIELGSTRIKACLIGDDPTVVLATGSHEWENQFEERSWTYSLDSVWKGIQAAYADLASDVQRRFGHPIVSLKSIGISAMMHGYLAFDAEGNLLVPFRTWRNTSTGVASRQLSDLFGVNIPVRWSIAHLHQAVLDEEAHVPDVNFVTTLAGYVHWQLTGWESVMPLACSRSTLPPTTTTVGCSPATSVRLANGLGAGVSKTCSRRCSSLANTGETCVRTGRACSTL